MYRHLVTVEVSVERLTYERVNLNGLTVYEYWLESLDTKSVKSRCTVKKYWVLANNFFENVPYNCLTAFNHALSALDVLSHLRFNKSLHNERLEEFKRHHLWQTTLVQFELRSNNNY